MNLSVIIFSFIGVNTDFFLVLLMLLHKYQWKSVLIGYWSGLIIILGLSFILGHFLQILLPEWILGLLGCIPLYLAFHDNDSMPPNNQLLRSPIIMTLITFLTVCGGCNLSLFLPLLTTVSFLQFLIVLGLVVLIAGIIVGIVKIIGDHHIVQRLMTKYGEIVTKIVYLGVGIYVFWDSGLINKIISII
ncbi:TMEM165/GDT1 family protein [Bombilactobacillus folatiphilus]|uniref:TMEM165/GDT1 family protein n=1 Tax=Bombilactobacillus folatiphilus TaxID=2923362 RepID=A0ABY4P7C6_9LACO|nr:cadmium resistance transporter [Bombilactobacillus folatiphilus]UQS81517.1 TMEM165/GDT1 family protein [Bombilactobacillus folatiphilus]